MGNVESSNVVNPKVERPPVSKGRIIGEVLAAMAAMGVVGGLGGVIFIKAYYNAFHDKDCMAGLAGLSVWIRLVCPFLIPLAAATTVYLIGRIGEQTGSFWATLGLSIVGPILGMIAGKIALSFDTWAHLECALLVPSLGAVIGFNLTRRYKETFAPKAAAQKDFFQLVKEFESKASENQSARSEQAGRQ